MTDSPENHKFGGVFNEATHKDLPSLKDAEKGLSRLKSLGSNETNYKYDSPDASILETFPNPHSLDPIFGATQTINITCPEFTSLCPKTGQPDFATIIIDYIPKQECVESKSLKLYLGSFRNHGEFHESCVHRISKDLIKLLDPSYLKVKGEFTPRGGIPFWPEVEYYGIIEGTSDNKINKSSSEESQSD